MQDVLFRWHWNRCLEFKQIERVVKTSKMLVAPPDRPFVFTMADLYNVPVNQILSTQLGFIFLHQFNDNLLNIKG